MEELLDEGVSTRATTALNPSIGHEPAISATATSSGASQVAETLSPAHHIDTGASVATSGSIQVKRSSHALPNDPPQHESMSSAHAGLKPWPKIHSPVGEEPLAIHPDRPSNKTTSSPYSIRPPPDDRAPSTTSQPYYDSTVQPLSVSQQTSASAVRDMALRKGTNPVLNKENTSLEQRPLKSALKSFSSSKRVDEIIPPAQLYQVMSPPLSYSNNNSSSSSKLRFPRWSSLLSRNNSGTSDRGAAFSPVSRTGSTRSGLSDHHQMPHSLRPKRSIGWDKPLQQYDEARNSSAQSDVSDRVRQAKLAEGDVYEKAKMNVRRPPKGIQNWFDGFEISSDEDDVTPLAEPQHSSTQHQSDGRKQSSDQQHSHDARRGTLPSKAERLLGHSMPTARPEHDSLHDRLVPADPDKYQNVHDDYFQFAEGNTTPKPQSQAYRNPRYTSSHHTSSNSRGSSFNDTGTDRSDQHYRSSDPYSSNSEAVHQARTVDLNRPNIPPRRMHNVQAAAHDNLYSKALYQSGSSRPPLPSHNSSSKFSSQSRRTYDDNEDEEEGRTSTFKSYNTTSTSSTAAKARAQASARISSLYGPSESSGGVPLDGLSAEIQHMMAVTDEEMALLEMMRNKRAAMNKNNYTRGYRKALEREHEQLMQRRLLAQQTALQILRDQQMYSPRKDETEETNDTTDGEVDEHEIMRLDKLRLEEINRIQRLEKYLGTSTSLAAALQDTGFHRIDPHRERHSRPSGVDTRPRPSRGNSNQQESDRSTNNSRHQRRSDGYVSPEDYPSPPAYDEERMEYVDRPKKSRSNIKATRHLATLEEERLSAAFERAQRKSRSILANHSSENMPAQQKRPQHQDHPDRARRQTQTPTFLRSVSDYQSGDYRSITSRDTSMNASVVSPLTPSSLEPRAPEKRRSFGSFDSEDEDMRFSPEAASSPEMNFSKPSRGLAPAMPDRRKHKKQHQQQFPSTLAMIADEDRRAGRESLESSGSAGGDVLAAWAELGGAEGTLPGRRPRAR